MGKFVNGNYKIFIYKESIIEQFKIDQVNFFELNSLFTYNKARRHTI